MIFYKLRNGNFDHMILSADSELSMIMSAQQFRIVRWWSIFCPGTRLDQILRGFENLQGKSKGSERKVRKCKGSVPQLRLIL